MPDKILFLDDQWETENWKHLLSKWLPASVEAVYEAHGYKALERLKENPDIKLVFLDMQFEGQSEQGEEILNKIKDKYPDIKVIVLTGAPDVQSALRWAKERKIYNYFEKGKLDKDLIVNAVNNALDAYDTRVEAIRTTDVGIIIGESSATKEMLRLVDRVSTKDVTVLITGESGTGKELVAHSIHKNSPRRDQPFIAFNCGEFAENLIESELFGHTKGAFTDAKADKRGRFELAKGGTIFLDEVAEMTPVVQAKLLRVLEAKEVQKVGSETPIKFSGRVVAATNQDVEEMIKQKDFRGDFYYRFSFRVKVPALRERIDDLPALVGYHMQRLNNQHGEAKEITDEAIELFKSYNWPGNIRELRNVLETAIISIDADILDALHFASLTTKSSSSYLRESDDAFINKWVDRVLNNETTLDEINKEFGAGEARKKIIRGILDGFMQQRGKRPTGDDIAALLKTSTNNLRVLLNKSGIQLKEL